MKAGNVLYHGDNLDILLGAALQQVLGHASIVTTQRYAVDRRGGDAGGAEDWGCLVKRSPDDSARLRGVAGAVLHLPAWLEVRPQRGFRRGRPAPGSPATAPSSDERSPFGTEPGPS